MVTPRRSTRSSASPTKPTATTSKHFSQKGVKNKARKTARKTVREDEDAERNVSPSPASEAEADDSDAYQDEDDESDAASLHSDALDDVIDYGKSTTKKRKRASTSTTARSPKKTKNVRAGGPKAAASPSRSKANEKTSGKKSPAKKRKAKGESESDAEATDEGSGDIREYEDGLEVVGTVVEAPKTGRVPPGQISRNTLNFLSQLKKPECNDRTWFKLHEPVYRQAEKEWKDFIDEFTPLLMEADPHIPPLPPSDVVHRIYRDMRFSNDKTPYKTGFSASFSRSGRKGIFAGFKPGESLFAAGTWCPGKNELQTIRSNILRNPSRLRDLISAHAFVKLFGEPKPHPKGQRRNIFGMEDELKVAPKGVGKDHKDIDLLKCRSFAVSCRFTDAQVLSPDFKEELKRVVEITRPFVHGLNDMMTVQPDGEDEDENDGGDE